MWVKNCIIAPSFQNKGEYSICNAFPLVIRIRLPRRGWKHLQVNMYGAAIAARKRLAEQTTQQGDQGDANQGNTAASHELLHTLTLCCC